MRLLPHIQSKDLKLRSSDVSNAPRISEKYQVAEFALFILLVGCFELWATRVWRNTSDRMQEVLSSSVLITAKALFPQIVGFSFPKGFSLSLAVSPD